MNDRPRLGIIRDFVSDDEMHLVHKDEVYDFTYHDGYRVWVKSPTGGETDFLQFSHYNTNYDLLNKMYEGKKIRIVSRREWNGPGGNSYWINTIHNVNGTNI